MAGGRGRGKAAQAPADAGGRERAPRPRARDAARAGKGGPRAERGVRATGARAWPVLPWPAVLGLVLVAAAWLQRGALGTPFLSDDFLFLDQVRARSLWSVLTGPDPIGNFVRPVGRQLWFWLLARAGGESPLPFHVANLLLFLGAVALLFVVARRLAGTTAATIAAAFVALHYAADVPLRWAAGSQDLLALVGALGALALALAGRRALAALALLAAMLSKETVVFTPVVAALAARRPDEPWHRSAARVWPLALAVAAWAGVWLVVAARQPGARAAVSWSPSGFAAAFAHLAQVALGLEWRRGAETRLLTTIPPIVALLLALAAVGLAGRGTRPGGRAALVGLAWALLGAVPVAAVASGWSAYYYLFALCGAGLLLGSWLAARPRDWTLLAVALLAWGSENGRNLDEFITTSGAWTSQSHVNRFYVERATSAVQRYLGQLERARPTLPPRSTLFFGGLPSFVGFQSGDGPLVRWAYRDTSLRSYYLMQFSAERYRRGPAFAFAVENDTLTEIALDREFLHSYAMTAMISDRPRLALDLLALPAMGDSSDPVIRYWSAWPRLALGDTAGAYRDLERAGMKLDAGPTPEIPAVLRHLAAGDSVGATSLMAEAITRHALDPAAHQLFGGLMVNRLALARSAAIEAYAAVLLAPSVARNWWLLGFVQFEAQRYDEAQASIERFLALGGDRLPEAAEARHALEWIQAQGPGGRVMQRGLRAHMKQGK